MYSKNNSVNISREELLEMLVESYTSGVSSYYDLAQEACNEILTNFVNKKTVPANNLEFNMNNTTLSISGNLSFENFDTYISNVFVS